MPCDGTSAMKLGVRGKLVGLLIFVGLLPLAAAVATIVIGGGHLRGEAIGRGVQSMAAAEALALQVSLTKDIEKLHLALHDEVILAALADTGRPLSPDKLAKLDAAWPSLPVTDRRLAAVLDGPGAAELRRFQSEDPRFAEIFVTDRHGQLVAATGRTTDFYQADEDWWQGVGRGQQPRIFIPPVDYDVSAGVWSIDLCIPINKGSQLVGIGKASLDVSRWLRGTKVSIGQMEAAVMFVRRNGTILYRDKVVPLETKASEWHGPIATSNAPGWRVTKTGEIQGYAPIQLPRTILGHEVIIPRWSLVLCMPEAEALRPVTQLSMAVLAIGLAIIVIIFLAGLYLVDRIVIRRVYRIRQATRNIAAGDLTQRVEPRRGRRPIVSADEIDALAEDFNNMASQIQRSHEELTTANQLKINFIRIAGHELRTPVSYLLAMARLLKNSQDTPRLLRGIQSMAAKAKRLDEIIHAMFKLMPDQRYTQQLQYSEISVAELLEEAREDCLPFLEQRKQRLIIEGIEKVKSIRADRAKLRDVLENLVMNAIKFTPDAGVVKLRLGQQLGGYATFAVQDQGPGIPDSDIPHIFEPFYSGSDVMRHSSGQVEYEKRGMGLGLAIVRHFVELHGGSINVSTTEHGSTFTITIPIEPPPGPEEAAT